MIDTQWYSQSDAKSELDIDSADTVDDDLLDDYGDKANRKIDNLIFPFKDDIPESADITEDLKGAAVCYVAYRYKLKTKEFEASKMYKEEFENILFGDADDVNSMGVIGRYRATPETRAKRVAYSKPYATSPLSD